MISVEEAIKIVQNNTTPADTSEVKKVEDALGYTLFEDVLSPIDMPPFRQSAMDGYAICLNGSNTYVIIGEVKAGDGHHPTLKKGEAIRIFTGAPVPDTANAVVMQEKTRVKDQILNLTTEVQLNENIRPLGEQVLKGQTALTKGTRLTVAGIAYLTSLGITQVKVYTQPSIAVLVTGNELVQPGQDLAYGQIYESNATMMYVALKNLGFKKVSTHNVKDDYKATLGVLEKVIENHDVTLISGGISVGEYDFVEKALNELGIEQLFYKVNQKPGKPLFFGRKDNKTIFALPGNPAAALSCFYVYVLPALQKMSGNLDYSLTKTRAISNSDYSVNINRAQFLKAIYNDDKVDILTGQNSSMLHTFALANALVYIPESSGSIKINDLVEVILLP